MTEIEATVTDGYRTKPFEATLMDIEVKESFGKPKLLFDFGDEQGLSLRTPNKIIDGNVPGYITLGVFIKSLSKLTEFGKNGIRSFLDVDDDTEQLIGFRTEPDICGMLLSFDVEEKPWINDEGENKIDYEWRVIKAESSGTPPPKPQSKETPAKEHEDKAKTESDSTTIFTDKWTEITIDCLANGPQSESKIMNAMKVIIPPESERAALNESQIKAKQTEMNKYRRKALDIMTTDGIIKKIGNEFVLV